MNANNLIDIQDLLQDLQVNQKLAEELLLLLAQENTALQKMDIRSLSFLAKEKETLLVKIHYLDNRITETVRQHVPGKKNKKLADLVPILESDQAKVLSQYNKNLIALRQEIQAKNLVNKRFTGDTLLFINDAISVFISPPSRNQLYGNKGKSRHHYKNPTMISREV